MPIEAMADPLFCAAPVSMNSLNSSGRNTPPNVSVSPTKSAPINAPRMDPMPPITMTTKARISTGSPMPTCTD